MSRIEQQGAQGDVYFARVSAIPDGFAAQPRKAGEPIVVAHSETGHNHVVTDEGAVIYEGPNPLRAYLRLAEDSDVTHQRSWDTHAPVTLKGGCIYEVRRQREYDPAGERRAAD